MSLKAAVPPLGYGRVAAKWPGLSFEVTLITLSVDEASNNAGCSLWQDHELLATTVLTSKSPKDTFSKRLQYQVPQLTAFLTGKPQVEHILFEGVRARLVIITVGAFLTCPLLDVKLSEKTSFIGSSSWKKWASQQGATGPIKAVKGIKALQEIGFPVDKYRINSHDVADSILMYLAFRAKNVSI